MLAVSSALRRLDLALMHNDDPSLGRKSENARTKTDLPIHISIYNFFSFSNFCISEGLWLTFLLDTMTKVSLQNWNYFIVCDANMNSLRVKI